MTIPSWRDDLDRPIDLVEEVLRVYGTEKIPAAVMLVARTARRTTLRWSLFNRRVTDYLVGHDFHECVTYTLRPAAELATWISQTAAAELALANPFVEDQSHLRPTLLTGLLESLKLNQSRGVAASRLFETGRVFIENNGQNFECAAVGFLIAEPVGERAWLAAPGDGFLRGEASYGGARRGGGNRSSAPASSPVTGSYYGWQEGHSAAAGDHGARGWTARFGLLNLALLGQLGVEGKVYAGLLRDPAGKTLGGGGAPSLR